MQMIQLSRLRRYCLQTQNDYILTIISHKIIILTNTNKYSSIILVGLETIYNKFIRNNVIYFEQLFQTFFKSAFLIIENLDFFKSYNHK